MYVKIMKLYFFKKVICHSDLLLTRWVFWFCARVNILVHEGTLLNHFSFCGFQEKLNIWGKKVNILDSANLLVDFCRLGEEKYSLILNLIPYVWWQFSLLIVLLPPDSSLLMICLKGMKNHTQFAFESLHLFLFFMAYLKKKKNTAQI